MKAKYYLKASWQDGWDEVSLEKFVEAEQTAGFHNKGGGPTATAGFSSGSINGRIEYIDESEKASPPTEPT